MVSIIIVSHQDDEQYLARALSSCVLQSVEHQVVLVFTGQFLSVETRGAIEASETYLHLLKDDPGHAECRNIAVEDAIYDTYVFLDADNYFYPEAVTFMYDNMGDADVVCGNMTTDNITVNKPWIAQGASKELFLSTNPVFISSLFTADAFYGAEGMDKDIFLDDYNLWCKMFKNGCKFSYVDRTIFYHSLRPDSLTHKFADRNEEFMLKAKAVLLCE